MLGRMGTPANPPKFLRVFSRSCGPSSQLYLGENDTGNHAGTIDVLGVDKHLQHLNSKDVKSFVLNIKPGWNPYPPSLTPSTPSRIRLPSTHYFSKCRLKDTSSITCCINQSYNHQPIVGMMLHYRNGRRACIGLYRHDWAVQPPLMVQEPESMPLTITMYHGSGYSGSSSNDKGIYIVAASIGRSCVKNASSIDLEGNNACTTLTIPWFGWLEWWFTNVSTESGQAFFDVVHAI